MALDGAAAILAVMSAGVAYFAWGEWSKYQAVKNTPRSTVRSIAMGLTELHGKITTEEPLEAPLTGQRAVAYNYRIERGDDDSDHTIRQGRDTTTATLTDDTGSVTVDLDRVSIEAGHDYHEDIGAFDNPSQDLKAQLDKLDVNAHSIFGTNRDLTFSETRIEPGDNVYLLGTARDNPGVKDGTATTSTEDILIEADNNQFLIANGDESTLRSTKKWIALGLVALSAVLTIGTLTYIIVA